jgi:hypothetical protein
MIFFRRRIPGILKALGAPWSLSRPSSPSSPVNGFERERERGRKKVALDYESLGGGAGAGILGAILAAIGFHRRLNRVEDGKQDKPVCDALHEGLRLEMGNMTKAIDHLTERIDFLINSRRE